jgi:hypothetical protein
MVQARWHPAREGVPRPQASRRKDRRRGPTMPQATSRQRGLPGTPRGPRHTRTEQLARRGLTIAAPRPRQHHPARRRRPGRAARRMGRRSPLPRTRRPHPRPNRQHHARRRGGDRAGTSGPHSLTDTPNRGINLVHHPSGLDQARSSPVTWCTTGDPSSLWFRP